MNNITQHYQHQAHDSSQEQEQGYLWQEILKALAHADLSPEALNLDLLAPIDQLHIGGRQATQALLDTVGLKPGQHILEIGSGLGGTARLIAEQYSAQITAIDITPTFTYASAQINQQLGYTSVASVCADACQPQVAAGSQDIVISQHTLMNIPDKPQLLATLNSSLKPGGKLLLHEVIAGENSAPLALPVPWASDIAHSHLPSQQELVQLLDEAGFQLECCTDVSAAALAWRNKHRQRETGQSQQGQIQQQSPLNPQLIFGQRFLQMGKNVMANLAEDKVRVIEAVFSKSSV